ncbi:MAG TPA: translocation/assembly module TamB domain-containing protein [Spirochaetia bacterium]|nr:translocation/assembly module TamB domain-containing protein [Spirochaetia bacterium]
MRRFLKHFIQALVFIALIGATARLLQPVQIRTRQKMEELQQRTIAYLEGFIGREIQYESISPSLLRFLEIRNLTIQGVSDEVSPLMEIRRVRVYYSFIKLFGKDPLGAVREIRIENSSFSLDTERDMDLLSLFSQNKGGFSSSGFDQIAVTGKNLDISVRTGGEAIRLSRVFFSLKPGKEAFQYTLDGKVTADLFRAPGGITDIRAGVKLSGSSDLSLSRTEAVLGLMDFSSNLGGITDFTLDLGIENNTIQCVKIKDRLPFDLKLIYNLQSGQLGVSFLSENFVPKSFIWLTDSRLSNVQPWLETIVTGRADISYNFQHKAFQYDADMSLILDNEFLPFPVYAYFDATGNEALVQFDSLLLHTLYGDLLYEGRVSITDRSIDGIVKKAKLSYRGLGLDGSFSIQADMDRLSMQSTDIKVSGINFRDLSAEVSWGRGSVAFSALGSIDLPGTSTFVADGTYQISPSFLEVSLQVNDMPIGELYRYVRNESDTVSKFIDPFSLTGDVFLSTDFKKFSFLSNRALVSDGKGRTLSASVSGNNTGVVLKGLTVSYNGYEVQGDVSLGLSKKGRVDFSSVLDVSGHVYTLGGTYIAGRSLMLRGNNGIDGLLLWYGDRMLFRLNTVELPIPLGGKSPVLTLNARGFYSSINDWELLVRNSSLSSLPIPLEENRLELSLRLTPEVCTLYSIRYDDIVSSLSGSGSLNVTKLKDMDVSGWIQLASPDKREGYEFIGSINPKTIAGTLQFGNASLSRIPGVPLRGLISGSAQVWGPLKNPDIRARISLPKGMYNDIPFAARGEIEMHDEGMTLNNLKVEYKNHTLQNGRGVFVAKNGDLLFVGEYKGKMQQETLSAQLEFRLKAGPVATKLDFPHIFERDLSGSITLNRITFRDIDTKDWKFDYSKQGELFKLSGGPGDCVRMSFQTKGDFSISLKDPIPLSLSAEGTLKDGMINASIRNIDVAISLIETFVDIPFVTFTNGKGRGAISMSGPVADPDINGRIDVDNFGLAIDLVPERIEPFSTRIDFSGKQISIPRTAMKAGKGRPSIQLDCMLDHWIPLTYDIRVGLGNEGGGTHAKYIIPKPGVEFDGYLMGSMSIQGSMTDVYIDGNLEVNSCTIAMGVEEKERDIYARMMPSSRSQINTMVNINFYSGPRIEFLWPSKTIPIFRSNFATGQKLTFSYDGRNGTYGLKGRVEVKGGEIFYFQRNFYLKEGTIVFNENQEKFDPLLTARAEIREIDDTGEQIRIYLIVDEKPFSQFEPRFESEPSRSSLEIARLLGLGGDDFTFNSALSFTGDLVSQFAIVRSFEQKVKESFNLDVFSFRTQMIQNVIFERVLNQYPENATGSAFGRYLDNTTLFLGKYFSDTLFLQAMFQLRVNNALTNSARVSENLVLDSEISFEWRMPLFLLNFSFEPDFTNMEENLNRFSIGLSWTYTY